jgi:predicted methyltransferase
MLVSRFGCSVVAFSFGLCVAQVSAAPMSIAEALADPARPAEQLAVDAVRKPTEVLALSAIKAGDRVADVGPGGGYYTRLISRMVGEGGKVYAFNPDWLLKMFPKAGDLSATLAKTGYANVEARSQPMAELAFDDPLDVVFISQLYHDQHWQKVDIAKMNVAIFHALKPGGVFVVIDHMAPAGTTDAQIDKLHRIDPDMVKREVKAAGFTLEVDSNLLANPADPLSANVFDAGIKGRTSQFVLKFRKP